MGSHTQTKSKKFYILIAIIAIIVLAIIGYFIFREVKIHKAKQLVNETTENLRNILSGGIVSDKETSTSQEAIDYINNYLVLESAKVDQFTNYRYEEVWGLSDITVKNNGNRSIKQFTITIFFKDKEGNTIGENNINIGVADYYNTVSSLKPNYEWSNEEDTYYELKNLSDNITPTRNEIKITNVVFE